MSAPEHTGKSRLTRREVIARVAGMGLGAMSARAVPEGAGLASSAVQTRTTNPPYAAWNTELKQLAPNVYAYTQAGGPGVPSSAISNGACILGPDHWLAIDAFAAPPHTKAFLGAASKVAGGRTCDRLINTHHHADHTTGNCFFLPAEIVGHEYCRQAVIKGGISNLAGRPESWKVGASELKLAPPTTTLDGNSTLTYRYGDTELRLIPSGPAHTWGDVLIYLPQHRILWAGDVAFFYVAPAAQSGHVSKWIETIDRIDRMDVDLIVPGHGPIGSKKELAETREYLVFVKQEARRLFNAGMSPGRAAAEIDARLGRFASWTDPAAIRIVNTVIRLYAEFADTLTPDTDVEGVRAATIEFDTARSGRAR